VSDYENALEQLRYPDTWCEAAQTLMEIGNRNALVPLMRAYETPVEASKVCLLDALDALDAGRGALVLCVSEDAEESRLAVHLMELFPNEAYLPALERGLNDPSLAVRRQARRSLACQVQTPAWETLYIRLLEAEDTETRAQAIKSLARRRTDKSQQALAERLAHEPV